VQNRHRFVQENDGDEFSELDLVLIHQTQHPEEDLVGVWEWNAVLKVNDGAVLLMFPLKHNYYSGAFDVEKNSKVAQLVRAPFAKQAVINGKLKVSNSFLLFLMYAVFCSRCDGRARVLQHRSTRTPTGTSLG
jgi:hypothetical protein